MYNKSRFAKMKRYIDIININYKNKYFYKIIITCYLKQNI